MVNLEGFWRLQDCRALDEATGRLTAPYGGHLVGGINFQSGQMLVALLSGNAKVGHRTREPSYFGGAYNFDGSVVACEVNVASDPARTGTLELREVAFLGENEILWRPPPRRYASRLERHELIWTRDVVTGLKFGIESLLAELDFNATPRPKAVD